MSAVLWLSANAFAVPAFELPWMNKEHGVGTFKSQEHPNTVFVVESYFAGCHYCNINAPMVNDLAAKYANDPRVIVLDVGVDRLDSQYEGWIKKHRPNHPVLKDATMKLTKQLGTKGYPSTYEIDAKGNVITKTEGAWESAEKQQIQNAIDSALKSDLE